MLIEMIAALILLTAFALVATRVFTWSMRVTAEAPLAEQQIHAFDSMLQALRADAWSASSVRTIDEKRVEAGEVRWHVTDEGGIVRMAAAGGETRTWPGVGARVRFESDDAGIVVRVLDPRGVPSDRILLVNEPARLGRAAP
jgi:type II secretory pathway pseudopilin PulG